MGTFTQSAGTVTLSSNLSLGVSANGSGTFNLQGGQISASLAIIGERSVGVFNQTSGTLTVGGTSGVIVGANAGSSGTFHLSGGILQTQQVSGGPGTSVFNFNGGTLQAQRNEANFLTGLNAARVQAGTMIDSNGFNLSIATPLLHDTALGGTRDGGLVKSGAGTLTLTGANTFTGKTIVNAGTLTMGAGGSLTNSIVEVHAGGAFRLEGGSVTSGAAAFFQVGNSAGTASATLVNGTLTSLETDLGNVANSTGNLTQSGGIHTTTGDLYLAVGSGSSASYTMSGGELSTNDTEVGWRGAGTFTQSGGTHTNSGRLRFSNFSSGNGTYRLDAGTLETGRVLRGSGAGTFYFEGGTLRARVNETQFLQGLTAAYIGVDGAKIDTNGFNVTVAQTLLHDPALGATADGGVTKSGAGTLTFTTDQTLRSLTISAGTVVLAASAPAFPPEPEDMFLENHDKSFEAPPFADAAGTESFGQAVPEPGASALLLASVLVFAARRRGAQV